LPLQGSRLFILFVFCLAVAFRGPLVLLDSHDSPSIAFAAETFPCPQGGPFLFFLGLAISLTVLSRFSLPFSQIGFWEIWSCSQTWTPCRLSWKYCCLVRVVSLLNMPPLFYRLLLTLPFFHPPYLLESHETTRTRTSSCASCIPARGLPQSVPVFLSFHNL